MGFYVKEQLLEDAALDHSHAQANPHTPYRGLQLSGLRYYNPELGRWVNRDPLGDEWFLWRMMVGKARAIRIGLRWSSRKPLYMFVHNVPIEIVDAHGLKGLDNKEKQAVEACSCALKEGAKASKEAKKDNPYTDETADIRDALMHCYVGARVAEKCGADVATQAGFAKEVADLAKGVFGGDTSDAEWRDIHNTKCGAQLCNSKTTREGVRACCQEKLDDGTLFPMDSGNDN